MQNTKFLRNFLLYLSIILIIVAYFLFIRHTVINCGLIIERNNVGNINSVKILTNNKIKKAYISSNINLSSATAYNIDLNGIFVKSVTPCKEVTGKVYSADKSSVEIDNATYNYSSNVHFYDMKTKPISSSRILPGFSCYKFVLDKKNNIALVVAGKPTIANVRVGISTSDMSSQNHTEETVLTSKTGFAITYLDKAININKPAKLFIDSDKAGGINISVSTKSSSLSNDYSAPSPIAQGIKNRIFVKSNSVKYPIYGQSLKRADGYIPEYYGTLEFMAKQNNVRIINEVDIEQYLKYVVPSEMPGTGGVEGYKVQAVAARTYVLWDMLTGRFASSGFSVTDTTLCQVYNNQPSNKDCATAVDGTKGLIMTYKGSIIDAKYYSTSCGVGARYNEVWYTGKDYLKPNTEPYLDFEDYTGSGLKSLSNEDTASTFFKDWTVKAYDSSSRYFRWKVTVDKKTLAQSFNEDIYRLYKNNPKSIKKKLFLNFYTDPKFKKPKADDDTNSILGDIIDIKITKRGIGGNVMEMVFKSDKGTFKVEGDSLIKSLLAPNGDAGFNVTPLYGSDFTGQRTFPSSFFVVDEQISSDKIKSITIYGGGFGHGAGMSQNGAISLARSGDSYDKILKTFYKNVTITDYTDIVKSKF